MKKKHNETNYKQFLEFKKQQEELAKKANEVLRHERKQVNLAKWKESLPKRFVNFKSSNLTSYVRRDLKKITLSGLPEKYTVFVSDDPLQTMGGIYLLIESLIKAGHVSPSEVKQASLFEGIDNVHGTWEARDWKANFFNEDAKVVIIEGCSPLITKLQSKLEANFWREVMEFVRKKDRILLISYTPEGKELQDENFKPSLSSDRLLNLQLLANSIIIEDKEI